MIHSTQVHCVKEADSKAGDYLAGWKRERAEFDNYRKRVQLEKATDRQRQRMEVIQPLLDVSDNFKSIVRHVPEDLQDNAWTQGVLHVARQLEQMLTEQGIETIGEKGIDFDPAVHEAIEKTAAQDEKAGRVVEVLQVGYKLGEAVIRPAKVKISE